MPRNDFGKSIFVNCPFDPQYDHLFEAIIFAVQHAGFRARCAKESADGADNRLDTIAEIIAACKYGIHDISRIETTKVDGKLLPRFNMPLELGLFLGCKRYGDQLQRTKVCLILDSDPYRYRNFISDIAGQDIEAHRHDPEKAISLVCRWLSTISKRRDIPGGAITIRRFQRFQRQLPRMYAEVHKKAGDVGFIDYLYAINEWLRLNVL